MWIDSDIARLVGTLRYSYNWPRINIDSGIGERSTGGSTTVATTRSAGSTIKSEPGFEPGFSAVLVKGMDWITIEPNRERFHMDFRGLLKYLWAVLLMSAD